MLRCIVFFEEENPGPFSFGRSKKIVLHLLEPHPGETKGHANGMRSSTYRNSEICNILDKMPGPADHSVYNYVKLSFKEGLDSSFTTHLSDTVMKRAWEFVAVPGLIVSNSTHGNQGNSKMLPQIKTRTGIIGIERSLQEKQKETDESISLAFQDLAKLMDMAKDMVAISKTISDKIRVILNDSFDSKVNRLRLII